MEVMNRNKEMVRVDSMQLGLIMFKEEEGYVVYCPALELCGCGKTKTKAQQSFNIVLEEYVRYTTENQTLVEDLIEHGWKIKEDDKKLIPPKMSEYLNKSSMFSDIFNNYEYEKRNIPVSIPLV
ncbi:MAG: hypothetical protein FWH36_06675 [Lentimicrobiaceae bacterium]|nr:hypothetical protein [Lentimicrobiaceae bacterium]